MQHRQVRLGRISKFLIFAFGSLRQFRTIVIDIPHSHHQARDFSLAANGQRKVFDPSLELKNVIARCIDFCHRELAKQNFRIGLIANGDFQKREAAVGLEFGLHSHANQKLTLLRIVLLYLR